MQEVATDAVGVTATQCGHPPPLLFGRTKCIGHRHGQGESSMTEIIVAALLGTALPPIIWKHASANVLRLQIAIG